MRTVAVLDTSLYCCWLGVPGRETAGSPPDLWNKIRVENLIAGVVQAGGTIILPLATIIEAGNHIAQAPNYRFQHASKLSEHLRQAIRGETPWATFTEWAYFWTEEQLLKIADEWPKLADARMSFGDMAIKSVADYYSLAGFDVKILTADKQLRSYEPTRPVSTPRRSR